MNNLTIRLETEKDYRAVEELTREAFWNVYKPGADEHYYVHRMRNHPDFIPELAFVLELDGKIIGNIMYTKAWLEDENGDRKEILSFGPLSVAPEYQRRKFGKILKILSQKESCYEKRNCSLGGRCVRRDVGFECSDACEGTGS